MYKINFYKVRIPTLRRTAKNERIIEEMFYYYVCPECGRDVVVIKRKAVNAVGLKKALIPEKLIGEKAAAYLSLTTDNRINKTSELRYNTTETHTKGIPLTYYKTISATVQRPRYLNECGFAGDKVENEVLILS